MRLFILLTKTELNSVQLYENGVFNDLCIFKAFIPKINETKIPQ
jgi:hypothetical protein